jgi:hypothetical protein
VNLGFDFLAGFVGGSVVVGCLAIIVTDAIIRDYVRKGWCDFRKESA